MKHLITAIALLLASIQAGARTTIDLGCLGVRPNAKSNSTITINRAIAKALKNRKPGEEIVLKLPQGRYDFYPDKTTVRTYYISNHDQDNPKQVGMLLEGLDNVCIDGSGSEFIFHGRMLPVALTDSRNCSLKNFSVDIDRPHITQVKVVDNDTVAKAITYRIDPAADYELHDGRLIIIGEGWTNTPQAGIAFEPSTRHLVYRTGDIGVGVDNVTELERGLLKAPWDNPRLTAGTVVAMRTYDRPAPGIFLADNTDTKIENVKVHYAEGMGLLAQLCENISLEGFSVCLKGDDDSRYFTTQADATHFSGCKGMINSVGGLYEAMMDDAINVHGTYLKIVEVVDSVTVVGRYMHPQSYGFKWAYEADTVQFIQSATMEALGAPNVVKRIAPEGQSDVAGAQLMHIELTNPVPAMDLKGSTYGIENLTWTPEVRFANNTVRNNRARGALFSTPRRVVVEDNMFDHTSGTAILLCGDCNGWFETGACHDVTIRRNRFVNALTNMFQFTNAVISIYPEIPDLSNQQKYFHSGITIVDNEFDTFDAPLLYAKSVDGLTFLNNTVRRNNRYPAFHWNRAPIFLERVNNARVQ